MKFKSTLIGLSLFAASGLIGLAQAQTAAPAAPGAMQMPAGAMTDGEVRKVDKDNKKITLKHGEIKNLGMPGMTMVFKVKEASVLDAIQVGSKVRFAADKMDGALIVTAIEAVR